MEEYCANQLVRFREKMKAPGKSGKVRSGKKGAGEKIF
jgi:hypothetical protein